MSAMEIAALVLEYLKVVMWPSVVVALALVYRRHLITVLERVRKASGFGASLELADRSLRLAEQSEEIPELAQAEAIADDDEGIANLEGEGAETLMGRMVIAWSRLERAMHDTAVSLELGTGGTRNLGVISSQLRAQGLIGMETERIAKSLQRLRNEIIHHADEVVLTPPVVEGFVETASNIERVIRAAGTVAARAK